jgi:hypothetical protein
VIRQDILGNLRLYVMELFVLGTLNALTIITLGIVWWQYRKAHLAQISLSIILEKYPTIVRAASQTLLDAFHAESSAGDVARVFRVDYEDLNGDGQRELLYQHPVGAHGCTLKIFGWKGGEFQELAQIGTGTPVGFEYGDFDGDGNVEIRSEETNWDAGLPYVASPRVVLLFRWNGSVFAEVSRKQT